MIFYASVFVYWVARLCFWISIAYFSYWFFKGVRTKDWQVVKTKLLLSGCIGALSYLALYCIEILSIFMCWTSGEFNILGVIGWGCIIN